MNDIRSEEFAAQAGGAGNRVRLDARARVVPGFYRDPQFKLEIMEHPDGRRLDIRYIPNAAASGI